jgi:ACT domain-containing protein
MLPNIPVTSCFSVKYRDVLLNLYIMLRKRVLRIWYVGGSMTGVHTIVVEVVVAQSEMSYFTITVDVASITLQPSCR